MLAIVAEVARVVLALAAVIGFLVALEPVVAFVDAPPVVAFAARLRVTRLGGD